MRWYTANTGNHQGLVIDEETGANIAVTYDKAHGPLVAEAPAMLAALQEIAEYPVNVDGYNSAEALRLRMVALQVVARRAIYNVDNP